MIYYKTESEIEIIGEGGAKLSRVLSQVIAQIRPGVTTRELDSLAEKLLLETGGEPSFKKVSGYRFATCMTVNDEVVHGLPSLTTLCEGDILGVDVGLYYKGWHTDTSITVPVGNIDDSVKKFLEIGKKSLISALDCVKVGRKVWDVSKAMATPISEAGYSGVSSLTGHGIGRNLHEEPYVPCITIGERDHSPDIKTGMVLAIETIYNQGRPEVVYKNDDNWTIATKDGSLSAVFEATIAVREKGPMILTPLSWS